ncbi:hypothetical protein F7734_32685 [Scytonema sp. UIC 10036]|uniref:hypothetical protein n=1 Tax=Scytonema sp. UIC 10036 TaxID=2304196 RepID=UPI0012DAE8F1|nr:hypothetical protein [Scytonema sp. UIC 10036]MUG96844.1 hypothetical protein [Scytonema sp. UIC 10036]
MHLGIDFGTCYSSAARRRREAMRWVNKFLRLMVVMLMLISIAGFAGTKDCFALSSNTILAENVSFQIQSNGTKQQLLKQVKTTIRSLDKYQQQIEKLKQDLSTEASNYYQDLSQQLSDIRVESHEKLVRKCQEYIGTCDLLERTAILRHDLAWIEARLENISKTFGYLQQKEWRLSHFLKTDTPVSPEERDEIYSLIANTKLIIDMQIPLTDGMELGRLEQEIFNQLRKT